MTYKGTKSCVHGAAAIIPMRGMNDTEGGGYQPATEHKHSSADLPSEDALPLDIKIKFPIVQASGSVAFVYVGV